MPYHCTQATIVFPDFIQSCSTDGEEASLNPLQRRGLKKEASLRGTKQSPVSRSEIQVLNFLFALYSLEIASFLAMTR
jgi:hypothetical protein